MTLRNVQHRTFNIEYGATYYFALRASKHKSRDFSRELAGLFRASWVVIREAPHQISAVAYFVRDKRGSWFEIAAVAFGSFAMTPHQITAKGYFVRGKRGGGKRGFSHLAQREYCKKSRFC